MKKAYFDNSSKTVMVEITGMPELEEFKEQGNLILDIIKKHGSNKILNDIQNLEANSIENQEWTKNVWFPKAEKAGIKYYAFIMAADVFGRAVKF